MIKPLGNRILVELDNEVKQESPIILVKLKEEDTRFGNVLAVGDGIYDTKGNHVPNDISVGDRVVVRRNCGIPIETNGKQYRLIVESEVIAII